MTGPFANRLFRIAFVAAGVYNLAFGLWAAIWPHAFFELFAIGTPRYPSIWACLGMVIGVYGLLYLHAAWKLETAWPIIAVGLLGKVLGPIGMAMSQSNDWPRRLGMICVYNDLIWWLPFGLFLVRGTAFGHWLVKLAPWFCVVTHVMAVVVTVALLQPGLLSEPDPAERMAYVARKTVAWSLGWATWMIAAASLIGLYAWWGSRLRPNDKLQIAVATVAVVIAAVGVVFDFTAEGLFVLNLPETAAAADLDAFTRLERTFTILSPGAANGLYTLGGLMLMLVTFGLPAWVRTTMWITWLAGVAMTIAALFNHVGGMMISTVILFPLLIVWMTWMGVNWRMTNDE
jgi:hypothetical protein